MWARLLAGKHTRTQLNVISPFPFPSLSQLTLDALPLFKVNVGGGTWRQLLRSYKGQFLAESTYWNCF